MASTRVGRFDHFRTITRIGRKVSSRRHGRGAVEVIVVAGILGFAMLLILMALPRGRESARTAQCQQNLMRIGFGLDLYHQANRRYPTIPALGKSPGSGPVKTMLDALVIPDFVEFRERDKPPKASQAPPVGSRVPGLACPSDPNAMTGMFSTRVSYRANAGETPGGLGGPFEPGRSLTSIQVDSADGLGYTAGFAERLVGDGRDRQPARWNYATSPGPVGGGACDDSPIDRWRGDAGSDWAEASWRSTLYGHALAPNAPTSCIADDGKTALMGASSPHPDRVNVLMMDGSLRGVRPSVDLKVWRALSTVGDPGPK